MKETEQTIRDKIGNISLDQGELDRLKRLVGGESKRIVIVSHTNPDGDAIGSTLGWGMVLKKMGHQVMCVVPNSYPQFLNWIPNISEIKIYSDQPEQIKEFVGRAEVIFCMDLNAIDRLETLGECIEENIDAQKVLIDHHLKPKKSFDITFSHPESSSTSYLVYRLVKELWGEQVISLDIAEGLYVGIMTDTGNFSFSNLTENLFLCVADLVSKGVDIPKINSNVYNSFTLDRLKLLGHTIDGIKTMEMGDWQLAYVALTEQELKKFNFQKGDSEGFVNFPLMVGKIKMSALFTETDQFIRISFRSRGGINVSDFARNYFNGGGHKNAAGARSLKPLDETIRYFEKSVKEYFSK